MSVRRTKISNVRRTVPYALHTVNGSGFSGPDGKEQDAVTSREAGDPRRPARIKDVAALAGVSLKTVTNVVHQRPYVKDETRARVQAAIEKLDYRPSLAGRQLQSGRSNIITLAVPRIDEPYLGALAHALIAAADAARLHRA